MPSKKSLGPDMYVKETNKTQHNNHRETDKTRTFFHTEIRQPHQTGF